MLTYLSIKNFAIIDKLELEFQPAMTVLTGETGAGKSIIIDTLAHVLGARADNSVIRKGAESCEVTAIFDLTRLPEAAAWLKTQEFASDNETECILRRSIKTDGPTRSAINGYPATQSMLRELSGLLINIHGQHEQQNLLKKDKQRDLLDNFGRHTDLCSSVKCAYQDWQKARAELLSLQNSLPNRDAELELLHYQVKELEELNLAENEIEELHQEQQQLSHAEEIMARCSAALKAIADEDDAKTVISGLYTARDHLEKIASLNPKLENAVQLLANTIIQAETAAEEIQSYLSKEELNPERLQWVEARLDAIYTLARKHHIKPEELPAKQLALEKDSERLENAAQHLEAAEKKVRDLETVYLRKAQKLSAKRKEVSQKLALLVTEKMPVLGMQGGKFFVALKENENKNFQSYGLEQIEFLVSTNAGQPLLPLNKVASGGELSRLSLAIQVITAETAATSTLIFDEVDVGIGGKTAEIVGQLLKRLGTTRQILCITHLPQVAAQGEQHLQVNKNLVNKMVNVELRYLNLEERIAEIARMLGGINITAKTRAHAREMLEARV